MPGDEGYPGSHIALHVCCAGQSASSLRLRQSPVWGEPCNKRLFLEFLNSLYPHAPSNCLREDIGCLYLYWRRAPSLRHMVSAVSTLMFAGRSIERSQSSLFCV